MGSLTAWLPWASACSIVSKKCRAMLTACPYLHEIFDLLYELHSAETGPGVTTEGARTSSAVEHGDVLRWFDQRWVMKQESA